MLHVPVVTDAEEGEVTLVTSESQGFLAFLLFVCYFLTRVNNTPQLIKIGSNRSAIE